MLTFSCARPPGNTGCCWLQNFLAKFPIFVFVHDLCRCAAQNMSMIWWKDSFGKVWRCFPPQVIASQVVSPSHTWKSLVKGERFNIRT